MKMNEIKREYRILALAIVIFIAGASFFFYDRGATPELYRPSVQIPPPEINTQTNFSNLPKPDIYRTFSYAPNKAMPIIKDTCHDAEIVLLVFRADLDYRKDIARASINTALPCTAGQPFQFTLSQNDIKNSSAGEYYAIVADRGATGAWYNPR